MNDNDILRSLGIEPCSLPEVPESRLPLKHAAMVEDSNVIKMSVALNPEEADKVKQVVEAVRRMGGITIMFHPPPWVKKAPTEEDHFVAAPYVNGEWVGLSLTMSDYMFGERVPPELRDIARALLSIQRSGGFGEPDEAHK